VTLDESGDTRLHVTGELHIVVEFAAIRETPVSRARGDANAVRASLSGTAGDARTA
jgi:hypothetical protein